jgi:hypothetical protein
VAGEAGGGSAAELGELAGSGAGAGVDVTASPGSSPSVTDATTMADGLDAPPDTTAEAASPSVSSGSVAVAALV